MLKLCGQQHFKATSANVPHYENITVITPGSPCLKPVPPDPPVAGEVYIDGNTYKRCQRTITSARNNLLTATGWTLGAGWTGSFAAGFTNDGSGNTLDNSIAYTDYLAFDSTLNNVQQQYKCSLTVTNKTTGSVSANWAGVDFGEVESIVTPVSTAGLTVTPIDGFDGTVKVSIKLYPDEIWVEHSGNPINTIAAAMRIVFPNRSGNPLVNFVTNYGGRTSWPSLSNRSNVLVFPGVLATDPTTSGTLALNLDMSKCEQRGFKSVAAIGAYLGRAGFDTCFVEGECKTPPATHYTGIRFHGEYHLWIENSTTVDKTWDVGWTINTTTGALVPNIGNAADTGYDAYLQGPAIKYCDNLGTDETVVVGYNGWLTDGSTGSLGVVGDFDTADWTCLAETGDPPWCYQREKFQWTLSPTEIKYQYAYEGYGTGPDDLTTTIDHTATVTLSTPVYLADLRAELHDMLDLWDLSDDVQYPWRLENCGYDQIVHRHKETTGYNDFVTYNTLPYTPSGFALDYAVAGGDGSLVGAPLPNGYGPHYDFHQTPTCSTPAGMTDNSVPMAGAFTCGATLNSSWGGLETYSEGVVFMRKFAVQHSGATEGPELMSPGTTGTGTNWTGDNTGFTHTPGSVLPLTVDIVSKIGRTYAILVTITGRTAGSVAIGFGGTGLVSVSSTYTIQIAAILDESLTATPTTDFDGTITFSIKVVPTGHWAWTTWDGSGCSDVAAGFTCTQDQTVLTPCNHIVACVSSTGDDAGLPGEITGLPTDAPSVFVPFTSLGTVENNVTGSWCSQPRFFRRPSLIDPEAPEYFCDECEESPLPTGCASPDGPDTDCDTNVVADPGGWV